MLIFFAWLKRHSLAVLGALGFLGALVFTFTLGTPGKTPANQLVSPNENPFESAIAATGLVEASSFNLKIGAQDSAIIEAMHVKEGQYVKAGQLLFTLDSRVARKDLLLKQAAEKMARSQLKIAYINLELKKDDWSRAQNLKVGTVIADSLLTRRRLALTDAQAQVAYAHDSVTHAQAQVLLSEAYVNRLEVRAPEAGKILKIYIQPGELLQSLSTLNYALLLGQDQPLYLRVQIDENDISRFKGTSDAQATLKGQKTPTFPLNFVRLDPYASPKQNLSGNSRQLIDTRVVEVIYEIKSSKNDLIIGQQLDVYIKDKKL